MNSVLSLFISLLWLSTAILMGRAIRNIRRDRDWQRAFVYMLISFFAGIGMLLGITLYA